MDDDRQRPARYFAERDRRIRRWTRHAVYPYSAPLRTALDDAGLGHRGLRRAADLDRLAVIPVAALGDGRAHVLEPDSTGVEERASLGLSARMWWAQARRRQDRFAAQHIDPHHRPIVWTATGGSDQPLFVAATAPDLDRLAELGRRALAVSGVTRRDRILLAAPTGSGVAHHQLVGGARRAGVAVLHDDGIGAAGRGLDNATVLAGTHDVVAAALAGGAPPSLRLVLVLDGPLGVGDRADMASVGVDALDWWAPPGARAAWPRCPVGDGFHTWPADEVVDVLDANGRSTGAGRLVWSAVGWHGSVWWRVDTGRSVAALPDRCGCGRTTPRLAPVDSAS